MRYASVLFVLLVSCGDEDPVGPPLEWEGIPVGNSCAGVGVCAASPGVVEPNATGGAVCSTVPGGSEDASSPETCDTLDNDCNGPVDDVPEGRCDRCVGLSESECTACELGDERGVFQACSACGDDCDRIVGPDVDGFICGCTSTLDCPCGFICDEIDIGAGVFVAGCRPP